MRANGPGASPAEITDRVVDQSRESGPTLDPVDPDREGRRIRVVVRCTQAHTVALTATSGVVVRTVLRQDRVQVALSGDQHPVMHSARTVRTKRSA